MSYQTSLYETKTNYYKQQGYDDAKAKEMAAAIVNPPGYSEHNCGLAADLNSPCLLYTSVTRTDAVREQNEKIVRLGKQILGCIVYE